MKKLLQKVGILSTGAVVGSSAFAATSPVDFSSLSAAADFSTLVTTVLLIGANIMIVYVAIKGFQLIRTAMKGA